MEKELKILFKVTSRTRPEKFMSTINNIIDYCEGVENYILASADIDDATMNNEEIIQFCKERNVVLVFGYSKNKIDAINRDMDCKRLPNWDILVNVSDDQSFIQYGFDNVIRHDAAKFLKNLDGVLHYPDGNRSDLMTMSIMTRKYYKRFGRIYHQEYVSVYCDNDAMEEAKLLKKYAFIDKNILVHNHPAYAKANWDDLYRKNESSELYEHDKSIFEKRKAINFGI